MARRTHNPEKHTRPVRPGSKRREAWEARARAAHIDLEGLAKQMGVQYRG